MRASSTSPKPEAPCPFLLCGDISAVPGARVLLVQRGHARAMWGLMLLIEACLFLPIQRILERLLRSEIIIETVL